MPTTRIDQQRKKSASGFLRESLCTTHTLERHQRNPLIEDLIGENYRDIEKHNQIPLLNFSSSGLGPKTQ